VATTSFKVDLIHATVSTELAAYRPSGASILRRLLDFLKLYTPLYRLFSTRYKVVISVGRIVSML
jgi:hypothetical protein